MRNASASEARQHRPRCRRSTARIPTRRVGQIGRATTRRPARCVPLVSVSISWCHRGRDGRPDSRRSRDGGLTAYKARKSCMDVHDLRVRPRRGRANAGLSYEASKIADERGDDARKEEDGDERIRELQEPLDEVRALPFFGAGSLGPYGTSRRAASAEVRPALDGSVAITSHAGWGGPAFGRRRRSISSRRRRSGGRSDDRRSPPRRSSDPGRDRVWPRSGRTGASPSRARR